jgi:ATP-dependent Clp protease ATP-binding subunit ClpC
LLNFEKILSRSIIGQKEAVTAVASAIKRARAGISSPNRPWASFLFLGPTGVGKSELAKVLTREIFGDEDRLIQIDMSEMMEMHSVSKLIGSPPGYVGYREGGQLTEMVRQNPHSVILFDEIEKAHEDVLNLLLQILEYGHLTDGKGKRVNFKNTIIILTSNIGAEAIREDKVLGFAGRNITDHKEVETAYETMKSELIRILKST